MSAISVTPAQKFIGNDGLWSPIPIKIGSQGEQLFLLPATSQSAIWTLLPDACQNGAAASNCTDLRGGVWNINESQSYVSKTPRFGNNAFQLPYNAEQPLQTGNASSLTSSINFGGIAFGGQDTVALGYQGASGPPLNQQLIYSYGGNKPYIGQLGLLPYPSYLSNDLTGYNNSIEALKAQNAIPSTFYGYNAGAYYRNAWSSLTIGGYDAKRGNVENVLEIEMNEQTNRDLQVMVNSISLGADGGKTTVSLPAQPWFIDSMIPEIWLPETACQTFEDVFDLTYNQTYGMYFIDSALHDDLVRRDVSVTFTLSANGTAGAPTTVISFPFAAFNQTVGWPIIGGQNYTSATQQYFPLKRAQDNTQFYLGRTFLQEAYLAADYDERKFYLSQATFDPNHEIEIRNWPYKPSPGLSSGAIAGIVVGSVLGVALIAGLILFFLWRKRKAERRRREAERASYRASSIGGTTINDEVMSMQQRQEYFKPPPGMAEVHGDEASDQFKAELDARFTARGNPHERHELEAGSISRSSFGVSPLRPNHHRLPSDPSSFGAPSPLMSSGHPSPPLATSNTASPFGGTPPAVPDGREWFGGGPFELHGTVRHRPSRRVAPEVAPETVQVENEDAGDAHTAAGAERQTEDEIAPPGAAAQSVPTSTTATAETTQTTNAAQHHAGDTDRQQAS